jgi:putative peptidoglycan lipid II flippase
MSRLARSSLIVAFFFGIDKVIGFVRAVIVNRQFGLTYDLDVFNAANNIPDLLSALISGGALGVALIPVLSEYLQRDGREAAWRLFTRIVNFAFIVTGIFAIVIAIFAPVLIGRVIAPGFPAEQQALAVELMRLDLFAILIFSVSGLAMAGLQANQHFLLPALAPSLYNFGQIFGALVLSNRFGMGIHGLVWGVIIGAGLHLLIQVPGLLHFGYRWAPKLDLKDAGVRQVLRLLGPRVATMFFIQMFFLVRDNLASSMGEGAVTALNTGWFIMQVPETLLGTAIAIALLPTISEIYARGETDNFRDTLNGAVRAMLALTIPSALLLAVGVRPLVQAAFGFEPAGTTLVVIATRTYLLGLAGHALLEIAARAFYAQQNAITPLWAAAANAIGYIVLAVTLSRWLDFPGIALANSIAFTTEAVVLLWLHNRKYPGVLAIRGTLLRVALASGLAGGAFFGLLRLVNVDTLGTLNAGLISAGGMLAGLLIVLPFIREELKLILKLGDVQTQAL